MTKLAVIDESEIRLTPVFQIREIENIPKSETAGHLVTELMEVVEVRFAGSKLYSPVFPADAFYKREGNQNITYAERWADQYRAFKEGNPQEAMGTPLEMLRGEGITPEQISLCRALKIYSIEALHAVDGAERKNLGMQGNKLKDAAARYMAKRSSERGDFAELESLRAQIAELKAASTRVPESELAPEEIEQVIAKADDAYAQLSDAEIKDKIAELNDGKRPQGNPSRLTLISMLDTLKAAA